MIEGTQQKLREAQFFLGHLEKEVTNPETHHTEPAAFYLSAFLSAARSVTNVLKAEEHLKYVAWSPIWRESRSESERRLLARFVTARNRAVKRQTPRVATDPLASTLNSYESLPPELRFFFMEDNHQPSISRVLKGRLTPDDAEEEILPLCREYAALLSALVHAFVEAHP